MVELRWHRSHEADEPGKPTASGAPDGHADSRRPGSQVEPKVQSRGPDDQCLPPTDRPGPMESGLEREVPRARHTWRDFELEEDLPRAAPHPPDAADLRDGRRNCGAVEGILYRQWDADEAAPPPEVVQAIDRLAELPRQIQERLAAGLDGIYVGSGAVPDLDDMEYMRGHPLPGGRATWDVCAGSYGDRKIVVGDQPSPTPDVMMHEIGHALDDIDGPLGIWLSDSGDFRQLYEQCLPHLDSDFHRQPAGIGRKEFFADAFAAIASHQRPALLDMLGGDTHAALAVMLYFNRRYGI